MKTKSILRLIIATIVVLIAISISTTYAATVESNQYKITNKERKKLYTRNISKY